MVWKTKFGEGFFCDILSREIAERIQKQQTG
uniref:Uncharacterized protein n=1 Tax=Siphoviridae sp. ctqpo8 TaxID=2826469 RepID=A0A8S5M2I7_9CAUD|nr:MAG TPA: hypothetical protein [Siphoviridae sp. ctqpo8]